MLGTPLQRDVIELETGMGIVPVELERDESGALRFGRMVQPVPSVQPYPDPDALLAALGVAESELPIERYDNGPLFTFVTLGSRDAVAGLEPDYNALTALEVNVSCIAGSETLWKTRMFAPALGVPEDPATGAAAGPLMPSAGMGSSPGARRSRSPRARRSDDLPPCMRAPRRGWDRAGRGRWARGRGRPWRVPSLSS